MQIPTPTSAKAARSSPIVAKDVSDGKRLDFLPRRFGSRHVLQAESMLYDWMRQLSPDYTGGFWRFVDLSNGGFYLAPDRNTPMRVRWKDNGFDGSLSPDAAGIVATLFTLSHLSFAGHDEMPDAYQLLLDYAANHPENASIFRAID